MITRRSLHLQDAGMSFPREAEQCNTLIIGAYPPVLFSKSENHWESRSFTSLNHLLMSALFSFAHLIKAVLKKSTDKISTLTKVVKKLKTVLNFDEFICNG